MTNENEEVKKESEETLEIKDVSSEELKEEKTVEDKLIEKKEETVTFDGFIDSIEVGDSADVAKKVNEARLDFSAVHKQEMKKNRIIGIVFLVVMVGSVALAYALPQAITYMFIAIVAFFILSLVLSKKSRSKMDIAVGEYLNAYGSQSDSYVYNHESINDVKMGFRNKPDEEVIRSLDFKEKVFHIGSRDVIKGTMDGIPFITADASIKTGEQKDRKTHKTVFVGKVIEFKTGIEDEGRVLLYLKGCGDADPDKLSDVNMVTIDGLSDEWKVFSSNKNYDKIFTKDIVDSLNAFKTNDIMNDLIISFQKERVMVALSYADSLMIIPLESEFKMDGIEQYKKDIEKVTAFAKALNKNKYIKK